MESLINKRKKSRRSKKDWPKEFLEKVNCPICGSDLFKRLYPKYYERIVKCDKCDLIYTNPRLLKKYLKHLYSKDYFKNSVSTHFGYENYAEDEKKIVKTFKERVEKIESQVKRGTLLDVGCAMGFFMKAARDAGWKVNGVEISKFASDYAKKKFNFEVYTADFLSYKPNTTYNLITMWDVIEHFYDPISALKKANSMLKKDGLLVLSTPDVGSLPAILTKERWVGYKLSDEHLTYFSQNTISKLLEKSGFKIVKKTHIGKHVSIPMLADRISIYNNGLGKLVKMTGNLFPKNYFLYINPFDIMCIYAKKI